MGAALAEHAGIGWRLFALGATRLGQRLAPRRLTGLAPRIAAPEAVVLAPPELLPGDAARGAELYAGTFDLAGTRVETEGGCVFRIRPPNIRWAAELHGFAWLGDLRACETMLAREFATAQIEDWLAFGQRTAPARRPDVAARRVLSLLVHAPFLLEGADPVFHRRYLRNLGSQIRRLRREARNTPPGLARLTSAIALTAAGLCLSDAAATLRAGRRRLTEELERQILADGGHISRNPQALIHVLGDLLPLRQLFIARQLEPPGALFTAIDRMLPMLRFFRHGDGAFALFNGMGATPSAEVEAILAFDDIRGRPVLNASHAGYHRMEGAGAALIMDTGTPPPLSWSGEAHAGTLSFEFSAGQDRLIVNCGAPLVAEGGRAMAARSTPAHSTLTIADTSSSRFLNIAPLRALLGPLIVDGPRNIEIAREDGEVETGLRATHDGYRHFGLLHERAIVLSADGTRLTGVDRLKPAGRRIRPRDFTLRFHLHPALRANRLGEGRAVLLTLPSNEAWSFSVQDHAIAIEESIFFADPQGPRRAEQIVITGRSRGETEIIWSLVRATPPVRTSGLPPAASRGGDRLL